MIDTNLEQIQSELLEVVNLFGENELNIRHTLNKVKIRL